MEVQVSRSEKFVDISDVASACHRDAKRWSLLYRVLWRLTHGEPTFFEIAVDPDVNELMRMDKEGPT